MLTKLRFLGATRTVTGSKYLLSHGSKHILIDCGLFQGYKTLRLKNWDNPPFDPRALDAVVLSHAHIDHSGYLPRLVAQGFTGPIYATEATRDLCAILLPDAGRIQEEDAARANRYGYSKHKPALPLYTEKQAYIALEQFKVLELGRDHSLGDGLTLSMNRAGHILGAAILNFRTEEGHLAMTGDLGRPDDPIVREPATLQEADYLVVDSTYGNRLHPNEDPEEELERVIRSTVAKGGTVLIPAFAVGRSQLILYFLYRLKKAGKLPNVPIYLDSPMAQDATAIFYKHAHEHRLSKDVAREVCHLPHYIQSVEESKALHQSSYPSIIVSASGMLEGGRVLHHLAHFAPHSENAIILTGFQAGGTRGDRIQRGEREVRIHGSMVPIRARVETLESLSSHADYSEVLEWLSSFRSPPRKVFLTHGEPEALEGLKQKIEERFDWTVCVPEYEQEFEL